MRLLLDTHTLVWWDNAKLPARVVKRIQQADEILVSAATGWEISIKSALGKIAVRGTITQILADYGFTELPIRLSHAEAVRALPAHHRDPFDRMLIAQAQVEGLVLITRDPLMRAYDVRVLWG